MLEAGHLCILLLWKMERCIDADAVQADVRMDTSCWPTYGSALAEIYISFSHMHSVVIFSVCPVLLLFKGI